MKSLNMNYLTQSRIWWLVVLVGVLLVLAGFAYWFWPVQGFAVASQLFGWLLIAAGIIQVCGAAGPNHGKLRGWWLAGGVIDMFIGFMLVRSVLLSEVVFPYFLAFLFLYWGIEAFINASYPRRRYWWLGIINGVLLCIIAFFFLEAGYISDMWMVSFLTSIAFFYWGFTVAMSGYAMKPQKGEEIE